MAVKLDTYAFENRRNGHKYDWDSWLDGDIWQLTKEEDFPDTTSRNLRTQALLSLRGGVSKLGLQW